MASPRRLTAALRVLSPRAVQSATQNRQYLRPETPVGDACNVGSNENRLSLFNVDTPNRIKILANGLSPPRKCRCILGTGGFGTVYKACYKGDQVAAKIIPAGKHSEAAIKAEKHATHLRHSNIVRVLMVEQGASLSLVAMELCGVSLQDRLEETRLTEQERIGILCDIARALQFCHNAGVVHADVKPKNILMAADNRAKLTDFGSSVLMSEANESRETVQSYGTPGYMAPEVLKGNLPTPAADIYSLGIVAWQMLSRKSPFARLHVHAIVYLSAKGKRPNDIKYNDGFGGQYKELYRKMWSQDPTQRPTATETIDHINAMASQTGLFC